ncbi:MAG: sigma-70 family RNA polymerase sigma factor [Alphaproteobacteria bacterium]|nr:sigma-70 family RNA polymerase sigma factor [Alphaproteobacteria bacterium]
MASGKSHKPPQALPEKAANAGAAEKVRYEDLLVRVGAAKDRASFVRLFEYFAPRVKSYLLKHGASETAAEEIVQNTFVTVWEKAAKYNPKKAAASTWIFTIARNKRIDALRREKFVDVNSDAPAMENASYTAEEDYATAEDVNKLNTAIDTLPPEQAALLRMAFFEEKSHSAISRETHLPLGTVKSRLRLALDKLRGIMGTGDAR